jgi:enamine deaminase RidA (YjgF/YER057c/UK114 family)
VAQGIDAQAERVFANIEAILKSAGMDVADLVKVNVYITHPDYAPAVRKAREASFKGHKPASTLAIISSLANPIYLVEIEGIAAKA